MAGSGEHDEKLERKLSFFRVGEIVREVGEKGGRKFSPTERVSQRLCWLMHHNRPRWKGLIALVLHNTRPFERERKSRKAQKSKETLHFVVVTKKMSTDNPVNVFDLTLPQLFIFPTSWLAFVLIGRFFFETGLGQYHSTSSKQWATLCKSLFLMTFVTACTLLELVTFEILDLLHPALRLFVWTSSLAILALLLNVCIPAVLAISAGLHKNLSVRLSFLLGGVSVLVFQMLMWITGSLLRMHRPLTTNGSSISHGYTHSNNGMNEIRSSSSLSSWLVSSSAASVSGVGESLDTEGGGLGQGVADSAPIVYRLLDYVIMFDVQESIANIAVLGTIAGKHVVVDSMIALT